MLDPFINWWLGKGYLLETPTVLVILLNLYISGLRSSVFTFKVKGGIFVEDKYIPLIGAVINLVSSIILVNYLGLTGLFLGTTISILFVSWKAPSLVYKHIFKLPVILYYNRYLLYTILTVIVGGIATYLCSLISPQNTLIALIIKGLVCLFITNFLYLLIFFKTDEFRYLINLSRGKVKFFNKLI